MPVFNARNTATESTNGKGKVEASKTDQGLIFRFLDLPAEVRLEIYGYYEYAHSRSPSGPHRRDRYPPRRYTLSTIAEIVHDKPEDDRIQTRRHTAKIEAKIRGIRGMKETRKTLLSVARQVSEEWAPIFYRTTTVLVNPLRPSPVTKDSHPSATSSRRQNRLSRRTAEEFKKLFMCKANTRLRFVTKIKYVGCEGPYWRHLVQSSLELLAAILQAHYTQLPSLRKVTLHAMNEHQTIITRVTESEKGDMIKAFSALGLENRVTELEQKLALAGSRNGIWSSIRKLEYCESRTFSSVEYWDVRSFKVVCHRERAWF